ncbi:MAG: hypothetical protein FWF03_08635, partial [Defluviitaleaceae bacterium]|nr:hypothetical protein [Defluviitaleaceae bacterium]
MQQMTAKRKHFLLAFVALIVCSCGISAPDASSDVSDGTNNKPGHSASDGNNAANQNAAQSDGPTYAQIQGGLAIPLEGYRAKFFTVDIDGNIYVDDRETIIKI